MKALGYIAVLLAVLTVIAAAVVRLVTPKLIVIGAFPVSGSTLLNVANICLLVAILCFVLDLGKKK